MDITVNQWKVENFGNRLSCGILWWFNISFDTMSTPGDFPVFDLEMAFLISLIVEVLLSKAWSSVQEQLSKLGSVLDLISLAWGWLLEESLAKFLNNFTSVTEVIVFTKCQGLFSAKVQK